MTIPTKPDAPSSAARNSANRGANSDFVVRGDDHREFGVGSFACGHVDRVRIQTGPRRGCQRFPASGPRFPNDCCRVVLLGLRPARPAA